MVQEATYGEQEVVTDAKLKQANLVSHKVTGASGPNRIVTVGSDYCGIVLAPLFKKVSQTDQSADGRQTHME